MSDRTPKKPAPTTRWVVAVAVVALLWLPVALAASRERTSSGRRPAAEKPTTVTPTIPHADRNQKGKVFLEYADRLVYNERPGLPQELQFQEVVGNVKLRKGGMFMYCDSAQVFEATNSVKAYGNVRMEQGDTLFVYADMLDYDGLDEMAVLYADPGKKVKLKNRDVTLLTEVFNYDMAQEFGYYDTGGELIDGQNKLTSWEGEYYPDTKDAFFNQDVRLTSQRKKDQLVINTDSLEYNTATHVAELVDYSEIINSDGVIYTWMGIYNTDTGIADLYAAKRHRSIVKTHRGNTLTGDTLFYDRNKQYGEAFGNVLLTDSARQSSLQGNYGYYDDVRDSAFVTGMALAKEYSRGDTLYLHGDSITAYVDLSDSMKVTNAFHRVRFYRSDLQGICDSLSMTERDSILYLYRHPVVWSGERQVFGNVIYVHLADSTVDWARLPQFGFMSEHIAEDCYNQLSGTDMTAWFADSTVRRLYVEGNVQLIMFPMESDSTYNKYDFTESSYMDAYFADNKIESIHFWPETNSTITPLYLAKKNSYFLPKFDWYDDIRPMSPEDVFVIPEAMIDLLASAAPIEQPSVRQPRSNVNKPNPNAPAEVMSKDKMMMAIDSVAGAMPLTDSTAVEKMDIDRDSEHKDATDVLPDDKGKLISLPAKIPAKEPAKEQEDSLD